MTTQTFTDVLTVLECAECRITFGITQSFERALRLNRQTFYCPRGHNQWFPGRTAEQERDAALADVRRARLATDAARDQAAAAERSRAAMKGYATRLRNQIANGVCPVPGCRRHFTNVLAHMATQHPDFTRHEIP